MHRSARQPTNALLPNANLHIDPVSQLTGVIAILKPGGLLITMGMFMLKLMCSLVLTFASMRGYLLMGIYIGWQAWVVTWECRFAVIINCSGILYYWKPDSENGMVHCLLFQWKNSSFFLIYKWGKRCWIFNIVSII